MVSYNLASNTNAQLLGGEVACMALAQYVAGYCAKNPTQVGAVLSVVRHVMQETEEILGRPPKSDDDCAAILKRLINAMDRKTEFGGQMAWAANLGHPACHLSHKIVAVRPWQLEQAPFRCIGHP